MSGVQKQGPLAWNVPIVYADGRPTQEFMRKWAAQVAANTGIPTDAKTLSAILDFLGTTRGAVIERGATQWGIISPGADGSVFRSKGAGADPIWDTISNVLDTISNTRGSVLYRGASGWVALGPGTAGNVLTTQGAGADPTWTPASGGGTEASIAAIVAVPAQPGWDPQFIGLPGDIVLSNSNKTATPASATPWNHMMGTTGRFTGKYYFEMKPASTSFAAVGVTGPAGHVKRGNGAQFGDALYGGQIGLQSNGNVWSNPSSPVAGANNFATVSTWAGNDVISVAVNIDSNLLWFRTNAGNWNNSGAANPATGTGGLDLSWAWSGAANRLLWPGANMGNTAAIILRQITADFTQSVPSGFTSWSGL